jgi:hypothetical protein
MPFGSLWLPVVLSSVAIFMISAILHMALKYHRADHKQLPDEENVREALRKAGAAPGMYMTPYCKDQAQMKDPAFQEKFTKGPIAILAVMPSGQVNMGKHLGLWFGLTLLTSFVAAYVARMVLQPGAEHAMTAFRITGTVAFAAYGLGQISDSIWKAQPWPNTMRHMIDAIVYAVVTGAIFCFLWPK